MRPQLWGTSDKPMQHKMWHVIYLTSFVLCPLCIYTDAFVHVPCNLVHHIPATIVKNYWHVVHYLSKACTTSNPVPLHGTQFYCIGLRSTTASPLASQPCKYISCTSLAQVPCDNSYTASIVLCTGKSLQYVV